MLVYGDHARRADPAAELCKLEEQRRALLDAPAGLDRHAALANLFIELAGVTQGVADARFAEHGHDCERPDEACLLEQLVAIAGLLLDSWRTGCSGRPAAMPIRSPVKPPASINIRLAEGYAFYALYPELYGEAAAKLVLEGPPKVIGLRSIGTGLAAIVASALKAPPPVTLRPVGDPFARQLRIAPDLERCLLSEPDCHYVIVDEGPGLSGSSFGSTADWLEERGVPTTRISFLSGHGGDLGANSSKEHRARWHSVQRISVPSENWQMEGRLAHWIASVIGPLGGPLRDLSAGQWRGVAFASERDWPPVNPQWERRKFLAGTSDGSWLVKFAGLGRTGEEKLAMARELFEAGFGVEPAGLVHGWLIERWHGEASISTPSVDELAAYLRFRRSRFPALQGASIAELLEMARTNAPQILGNWRPDVAVLQRRVVPVRVDGRMQRYEWRRLPNGQLLKTDAIDHHLSHDLVGGQDIAWDLAGAMAELDLSKIELTKLASAVGADPALLAFYRRAYLAFRIGAHLLSAQMADPWPDEARRNCHAAERLELKLRDLMAEQDVRAFA